MPEYESSQALNKLRRILQDHPAGKLPAEMKDLILSLLKLCWSGLEGTQVEGTLPEKLNRAEELCWDPQGDPHK
jgi:hypothetical protein